jgi:small subunit ribosomal protein S3
LGETRKWQSKWIARREYGRYLKEDIVVRKYLKERLKHGAITSVEIQRAADKMRVVLRSARPGIVIGRRGSDIDRLREELQEMTNREVSIDIEEVKRPELSAELVARNVAEQLARRISFRRAMKRAVSSSMDAGAKGIKVCCAGRLGGAEMSRTEWYREGRVPLHTIRADIDYACVQSQTLYGLIGVKVWIYKGEFVEEDEMQEETRSQRTRAQKDRRKDIREQAQRRKPADAPKGEVQRKKAPRKAPGKGTGKGAGTKEVPRIEGAQKKMTKAEADKGTKAQKTEANKSVKESKKK